MDAAIDSSRAAVLVVIPKATESGWVKDEYERLERRQNAGQTVALRRGEADLQSLPDTVATSPTIWSVLTPLTRRDGAIEQVARFSEKENFGRDLSFHPDPILRRLRWEGLLTREPPRRLVWRSEATRRAVREFVDVYR